MRPPIKLEDVVQFGYRVQSVVENVASETMEESTVTVQFVDFDQESATYLVKVKAHP